MTTEVELDYELLKPLYQAFDAADEALREVVDKLKAASVDTANTYFTGLVGPAYHQRVEVLCTNLQRFHQKLQTYHEDVRHAEQAFRQEDDSASQLLDIPD